MPEAVMAKTGEKEAQAEIEKLLPPTAPFDPRFPNTNQTLYCWSSYIDYHRCVKLRGQEYDACKYFQRVYGSICPSEWTERWDEQLEKGTFPGKI